MACNCSFSIVFHRFPFLLPSSPGSFQIRLHPPAVRHGAEQIPGGDSSVAKVP